MKPEIIKELKILA